MEPQHTVVEWDETHDKRTEIEGWEGERKGGRMLEEKRRKGGRGALWHTE
jgi:hypothetical protein